MWKTGWDKRIFDLVHWDAHEKAFKRLPRFRQHSTSKIFHKLVNTNRQNHLFYGTSSLCPICRQAEETLQHVFTCNHSSASAHRTLCLDKMFRTLENAQTPQPVLDSLKYGFHTWMENPTRQGVRAPTAGSLRGPDAVLTSAFTEQYQNIGWFHMCLGRVSKKWSKAVLQYTLPARLPYTETHWTSILVSAAWQLSRSLWKFWNEVVHGATIEEQAQRILEKLRQSTITHYSAYQANPGFILLCFQSLFTSRSLEERLQLLYDNLAAWNRSVEEAIQVTRQHEAATREYTQAFFPQNTTSHGSSESDSTYSLEDQSSIDTISFYPTTTTEATTVTSSSSCSSDTYCRLLNTSIYSEVTPASSLQHQASLNTMSVASRASIDYHITFPSLIEPNMSSGLTSNTSTSSEHSHSSTTSLATTTSSIPSSISWRQT